MVGTAVACSNVAMAGCGPPPSDPPVTRATPSVDCVAVLGAIPATIAQTPLAGIPYSGVAREKLIADLGDQELGHLCDFDVCMRVDGYLRNCFSHPDDPRFQLETLPLVARAMATCYPNPNPSDGRDDVAGTRDECMSIYRNYFAKCHVGPWEDCIRESASAPIGHDRFPSCEITITECPIVTRNSP